MSKAPYANPPFYSLPAFAALTGVPVETVAHWVRTGAVESLNLGKVRLVLFPGVSQ